MRHTALRVAVVETARAMNRAGVNSGTSGNVGARVDGGLLVTPTGVPYDELEPAGVVELDASGRARAGGLLPSSEWRLHRDVLAARPEVGAVVHAHPVSATALSCLRRGIPAFHYLVARAGGDEVPCAPYATYGTAELSANAVAALAGGRRACLLANHGLVATGATLAEALALAVEVEHLAATYLAALAVGEPTLLDAAEMARVAERLAGYGQPPVGPDAG